MNLLTFLTIWSMVVAAAIILALAVYLIAIAYYLYRAGGSGASYLAQLARGLIAVRENTAPLEKSLTTVAQALATLRNQLRAVDHHLAETAEALRR